MCRCWWVCVGISECVRVCPRIPGSVQVCAIVCGYTLVFVLVCIGVCGYARVCACVWDEFSEFLLENRVLTSADFNTYPIRIFSYFFLIFFIEILERSKNCKLGKKLFVFILSYSIIDLLIMI